MIGEKTEKLLKLLKDKKFNKIKRTDQIKLITGAEVECLKLVSELKQNFSEKEVESLDVYASIKYKEINDILRKGKEIPKEYKTVINDINNALKKNILENDIVVFRGNSGNDVKDSAYKSTSVNLYSAYNFSVGNNSTINAYKIPKGTNYAFIGGGEYEVLLSQDIDLEKYKII